MSKINIAAVKRHALNCSNLFRSGKFHRVGEDFLTEIEAGAEAMVRGIGSAQKTTLHDPAATEEDFLTPELREAILREANALIGRLIQNTVQKQPSVGKTLGRTY